MVPPKRALLALLLACLQIVDSRDDVCDEFVYTPDNDDVEGYEQEQGPRQCRKLSGGLTIKGFIHLRKDDTFNYLSSITEIHGPVTLENNVGFENFYFLKNLRTINASLSKEAPLKISSNRDLSCLGFDNLAHIYGGPNAIIEIQNHLPLCDIDTLRKSFTGEIKYTVKSQEVVDDTALGVALIIAGFAILCSIVYGSTYAIYRWEEQQAQMLEQGIAKVADAKKQETMPSKDDDKKDRQSK